MKKWLLFGSVFSGFLAWGQQNVRLIITPKVQHTQEFLLDNVQDLSGKTMQIEYFNYYLSNLHLFHDGNQDLDLSDTVFLVQNEAFILELGNLNVTQLEKISFGIGVPEPLNHLDIATYPDKHPLGFQTPSMHWSWTDGYMFMIVGGLTDGDADNTPETTFQIHSFGDANYYQVEIPVGFTPNGTSAQDILLDCNLDEWIGALDLAATGIHHGSTDLNATVLKNVVTRPVFTLPQSAGLSEPKEVGKVNSFTNASGLQTVWHEMLGLNRIELIDAQGKIHATHTSSETDATKNWGKLNPGIYFIRFFSKQDVLLRQVKVIY